MKAPWARGERASAEPSPVRTLRLVRRVIAVTALLLAAYCLIAATTALYAQPASGNPNPQELAARERHQWPGLIPIVFLALVAGYATVIAARRRGRSRRRPVPPSTQDPPAAPPSAPARRRDTPSR